MEEIGVRGSTLSRGFMVGVTGPGGGSRGPALASPAAVRHAETMLKTAYFQPLTGTNVAIVVGHFMPGGPLRRCADGGWTWQNAMRPMPVDSACAYQQRIRRAAAL